MEPVIIQTLQAQHWGAVRAIYQAGIDTGHATFESHAPELCLIAIAGGAPLGWAASGRASNRSVYTGVAEERVHVAPSYSRRGIGRRLLAQLISQSEECGYWTLQAGVFPENAASIALHRALGVEALGAPPHRAHGLWTDGRSVARRAVPGAAPPAGWHQLAGHAARQTCSPARQSITSAPILAILRSI